MKKHIILLTILISAIGVTAQTSRNDTINRMVLVESTYNPVIAGAVKRNFIPGEMEPSMRKETIVYADESMPISRFARIPHTVQGATIAHKTKRPGYLHLGFGNYNNINGLGAYSCQFKERHALVMNAHIDGWSGNLQYDDKNWWHSNLHDIGLNVDYRLLLGKAKLTAGINGAYYDYNYLRSLHFTGDSDRQQANHFGGNLSIDGIIKEHYRYHAAAQYDFLGRNTQFAKKQRHSQGHLHTEASVGIDLYEYGIASLLIHSDALIYQGVDHRNYFAIGIAPTWEYRYEDLHFTAGANLDFQGKKYGPIMQASPACKASYVPSKAFSIAFILDGGRQIHNFASLYTLSPYWASYKPLTSSYTYLNACLQGNLRIIEGMHLHLGGGYRIDNNFLFESALDTLGVTYTGLSTHNAKIAYANASATYTYKDYMSVTAEASYNHWMVNGNRNILTRAPQIDADLNARVRIIHGLYIHTDCRFVMFTAVEQQRERAIIDWSLGAHYAMNEKLSFFLDGHNLLNRRYERYTGYPNQGFNAILGAAFKF